MSAPRSIADTELGLTQGELQILRNQQQVMAQRHQTAHAPDRGRGTSRHSQPSSRNASVASSGGASHRVILDPRHLEALRTHLENVSRSVRNRIEELEDATEQSVNSSSDRHGRSIQSADAQIERMHRILAEIDRLEEDLKRISRIKDVVKRLKARIDATDSRLDRTTASHQSHASRDRDRHRH